MFKFFEKPKIVEAVRFEHKNDIKPGEKFAGYELAKDTIGVHFSLPSGKVVRPGDWLIVAAGRQFAISDADFSVAYELIKDKIK